MSVEAGEQRGEDILDLGALFARLIAGRWWIIVGTLFFGVAFTAAAFLTKPVYRASALLIPASLEQGGRSGSLSSALGALGSLASVPGINLGGIDEMATEEALAVLRSRQFTEAFLRDEQLMPIFFPENWDAANARWKGDGSEQPTPGKTYKMFDRKIRAIIRDKKTGLVTLQIDWTDRTEAARWANELVRRLNLEMRTRAINKANAAVGFLEKELAATSEVGTREAINRLIEAQIKQRMLANVTHEYAFRIVDKALPADEDDPVRPQKGLMAASGLVLGGMFGVLGVLLFGAGGPISRRRGLVGHSR